MLHACLKIDMAYIIFNCRRRPFVILDMSINWRVQYNLHLLLVLQSKGDLKPYRTNSSAAHFANVKGYWLEPLKNLLTKPIILTLNVSGNSFLQS